MRAEIAVFRPMTIGRNSALIVKNTPQNTPNRSSGRNKVKLETTSRKAAITTTLNTRPALPGKPSREAGVADEFWGRLSAR